MGRDVVIERTAPTTADTSDVNGTAMNCHSLLCQQLQLQKECHQGTNGKLEGLFALERLGR